MINLILQIKLKKLLYTDIDKKRNSKHIKSLQKQTYNSILCLCIWMISER